ncbi:MAG TPA: hypothetical protein VGY30_04775 [Solirubrobacteraceae bacterium]|jgi:hypothetical protein|nr:hypothetical protein [Solirubrobacteraceae bacterium]
MAAHLHLAPTPIDAGSDREATPIRVVVADHALMRRGLRQLLDGPATGELDHDYVVIPSASTDFLDWQDRHATITSEP